MKLNPEIFREYDIRGIADTDLTNEVARNFGQALATHIGHGKVAVGGDNRSSTERLRDAVAAGMLSAGIDVLDIGMVPTPVLYFATVHYNLAGGVEITASHNPPEFNGFKIQVGDTTIYGDDIQALRRRMDARDYKEGAGSRSGIDPVPDYIKYIRSRVKLARPLKVVIDGGNGCAGELGAKLLTELGCEVVKLYCEPDATYPHHHPDPILADNLRDLQRAVEAEHADLGIAYDGDGDRLGVVDRDRRIIWPDRLMILFYREILPNYPNAPCPIEVKCSSTLWDEVEKSGGKPEFCRTGHSLIKALMKRMNAPFAGEMSGHLFFADEYFGYDDALYATCRLVRILAGLEEGTGINELLKDVPEYPNTPELRVDCPDSEKAQVVDELAEYFKNKYTCVDVDGVRILFDDGWGLVRKSNTSPKLILRFEARTRARLDVIKDIVVTKLREYPQVDIGSVAP